MLNNIDNLSDDEAREILVLLRATKRRKKKKTSQKENTMPTKVWAATSKQPKAVLTQSFTDIAKFFIGDIIPDIENRSTPSIKAIVVEILEMLAETSPNQAKNLRHKAAKFVLINEREKLITAICSFAANLSMNIL